MKGIFRKAVFAIGLLTGAGAAFAGTTTSTLPVTASVASDCTVSTTPVAFTPYDPVVANASTALTATGTISLKCTKGATPTVTLNTGANASGSTLRMKGAATSNTDMLTYALYQPSTNTPGAACAYTTVWGSTGANIFTTTASTTATTARTYNVCGQIPGGQDVTVDSYSDTVTATVNF